MFNFYSIFFVFVFYQSFRVKNSELFWSDLFFLNKIEI